MKNYVQHGDVVTLIAPAGGVKSGAPLLVGSLFGICAYDALEAAEVEVSLVGVYDLAKDGSTINQGDAVYWDVSAAKITGTSTDNVLVGTAIVAAGGSAGAVRVRLGGVDSAALAAQITALAARVTTLEGA